MSVEDEEKAFQAALDAVSKKFEAKIPTLLSEITDGREHLEEVFSNTSLDSEELKASVDVMLKKSHTLAGSSGQFGHPGLTELARAVEEMCISIIESKYENPDAFTLLFSLCKDLEGYKY